MDWIKVLNRHTIFEYTDLSDSEFVAWIKIMSLTALMERMPTREQMLKHTHHKTLTSLQDKLKTHSTTLQDVLKKVLSDAQAVSIKRNLWKESKKQYREQYQTTKQNVSKDVHKDVLTDVSLSCLTLREEKRREENIKIKAIEQQPVDNFSDSPQKEALLETEEKEPDALMVDLKEVIEDINTRMPDQRKQRQVMLFVEANVIKKNHAAMMHCLKSLQKQLQNDIVIDAPKQYLEAALKIEHGKHNAEDHERASAEYKKPITPGGLTAFSKVMQGIARGSP